MKHMTRVNSGHCPILVKLEPHVNLNIPRPFRFQPCWLSHPEFLEVDSWRNASSLTIVINGFTTATKVWNKNVFGNIFAKKKKIEARLNGI